MIQAPMFVSLNHCSRPVTRKNGVRGLVSTRAPKSAEDWLSTESGLIALDQIETGFELSDGFVNQAG
mgnify:CR=1 FL=1